jgi:hypothetical protein
VPAPMQFLLGGGREMEASQKPGGDRLLRKLARAAVTRYERPPRTPRPGVEAEVSTAGILKIIQPDPTERMTAS